MVELLVASGEGLRLPAGTTLDANGPHPDAFHLLVAGDLDLLAPIDEVPLRLRSVQPGEFFGHDAALGRAPRVCSARTALGATVLRYERAEVERVLRGGGAFAAFFEERLKVSSARLLRDAHAIAESAERDGAPAEVIARLRALARAMG